MQVGVVTQLLLFLWLTVAIAGAGPKRVAVFVALCDNATQGIIPVPAKIGDGNKPADNLYWGCSDGLPSCLKTSRNWKQVKTETPADTRILQRRVFSDTAGTIELTVEGWRGSEIAACLTAFETALISGDHDLCAFVGHNVLMDKPIAPPEGRAAKPVDAIVLCCLSDTYFRKRLETLGARPVLMTTQFMYPGGFLLRDALPVWAKGKSKAEIRAAAGSAYAANQKIGNKAALGVFSVLP